jgi:Fe-S-cluster containining protein
MKRLEGDLSRVLLLLLLLCCIDLTVYYTDPEIQIIYLHREVSASLKSAAVQVCELPCQAQCALLTPDWASSPALLCIAVAANFTPRCTFVHHELHSSCCAVHPVRILLFF